MSFKNVLLPAPEEPTTKTNSPSSILILTFERAWVHGGVQLHELHGQVEVALDVGGIHDVDDAGGLFADDELPGDDLLAGVGRHGVDARPFL